MQALIFDDHYDRQARLTATLMKTGIHTFATCTAEIAESTIRRNVIDLLIAPERVAGKLTHTLVLLAEYRNPMVSAMILTDRTDPDVEELFLLLPSLHCLLAPDSPPELIRKLAIASMAGATSNRPAFVLRPSMRVPGQPVGKPMFFSRRPGPRTTPPSRAVA